MLVLIINELNFSNTLLESREGSDKDAKELAALFRKFRYVVAERQDLPGHEVLSEVSDFAKVAAASTFQGNSGS